MPVRSLHPSFLLACVAGFLLLVSDATLGQQAVATVTSQPGEGPSVPASEDYTPAIDLFPASTAGLLRIPDLPRFHAAFEKTRLGRLLDEPAMKPFLEAQRARAENYLDSIDSKVGLRPSDLKEIATGEVVVGWLPFEKVKRRPYALAVIADIRGAKPKAEKVLAQVDRDLIGSGATRQDITHRGQSIRVYTPKRKPGQLKVEQIAIALSDERIIASDWDSVVKDLVDAAAGEGKHQPIRAVGDFQTVLTRASQAIRKPLQDGGGAVAAEWFARPFTMGRILRQVFNVDRGNEVDIVKLLESQGFDAIKAAGGIVIIAGEEYDVLHRSVVLAPPVTDQPDKYELAARMMQLNNTPAREIPAWLDTDTATYNRIYANIEGAFWASESLINQALDDPRIFRKVLNGIRDDAEGPRLDIGKDVLPNLDDEVILITDNTQPINVNSERMLVAVKVRDAAVIKASIRKVMLVEPNTTKIDEVPGVEIWQVEAGDDDESLDSEIFKDIDVGFDDEEAGPEQRLLDLWAIALVDQGPGSDAPYLMFSSHPELLIATAKRIKNGQPGGFQQLADVAQVRQTIDRLGGQQPALDRVVRTRLSLRAKYELLRQGKLKESNSVLASLYRRFIEDEGSQQDPLNAAKLPPLAQIDDFFPDGGSFVVTTGDGWEITGFLLK